MNKKLVKHLGVMETVWQAPWMVLAPQSIPFNLGKGLLDVGLTYLYVNSKKPNYEGPWTSLILPWFLIGLGTATVSTLVAMGLGLGTYGIMRSLRPPTPSTSIPQLPRIY